MRMLSSALCIRDATVADLPQVLTLMQALASFEGYIEAFAVDIEALRSRAFGPDAQCHIQVAEAAGMVQGYAVTLGIAFTYDLRPTLVLKELYVNPAYRSAGVGAQLLKAIARRARTYGAGRLLWNVLAGNNRAEQFYQRHGGKAVEKWRAYEMDANSLHRLASGY
jgi:GNAT superfamily N-acetyltransferase